MDDLTALLMEKDREVAEIEEIERGSRRQKRPHIVSVSENGKEGKSKMMASCGFLEDELRQYSQEDEVTMADSVETLGVDLRKKESRRKEQARRKKMYKAFQKNYMKLGGEMLLRAGMVPASFWRVHAVGIAPTERLKLRRQVAAAAGKKSTTSLSLFMEAFGHQVEGDLLYSGRAVLGRRSLDGKMVSGAKRSLDETGSRSSHRSMELWVQAFPLHPPVPACAPLFLFL